MEEFEANLDNLARNKEQNSNLISLLYLFQKLTGLVDTLTTKADAKGNYEFSITIEDSELIKLVNSLSEAGNSLISKELPQPKQINKVTSTGKKVRYNVSILQEK